MCELALRPENQDEIYQEIIQLTHGDINRLEYDTLQGAVKLDSFIREVMRTKGDTFNTVRMTVRDVPLGEYVIPKGALRCPRYLSRAINTYLILSTVCL